MPDQDEDPHYKIGRATGRLERIAILAGALAGATDNAIAFNARATLTEIMDIASEMAIDLASNKSGTADHISRSIAAERPPLERKARSVKAVPS